MPLLVRPYLSLRRGSSVHTGPVVQSSLACHAFSGEIELIGMARGTPNQGTGPGGLRFPQITYSKDWTGKDKELSAFKLHELVRSIPILRKAKSAHRDQGVM